MAFPHSLWGPVVPVHPGVSLCILSLRVRDIVASIPLALAKKGRRRLSGRVYIYIVHRTKAWETQGPLFFVDDLAAKKVYSAWVKPCPPPSDDVRYVKQPSHPRRREQRWNRRQEDDQTDVRCRSVRGGHGQRAVIVCSPSLGGNFATGLALTALPQCAN